MCPMYIYIGLNASKCNVRYSSDITNNENLIRLSSWNIWPIFPIISSIVLEGKRPGITKFSTEIWQLLKFWCTFFTERVIKFGFLWISQFLQKVFWTLKRNKMQITFSFNVCHFTGHWLQNTTNTYTPVTQNHNVFLHRTYPLIHNRGIYVRIPPNIYIMHC